MSDSTDQPLYTPTNHRRRSPIEGLDVHSIEQYGSYPADEGSDAETEGGVTVQTPEDPHHRHHHHPDHRLVVAETGVIDSPSPRGTAPPPSNSCYDPLGKDSTTGAHTFYSTLGLGPPPSIVLSLSSDVEDDEHRSFRLDSGPDSTGSVVGDDRRTSDCSNATSSSSRNTSSSSRTEEEFEGEDERPVTPGLDEEDHSRLDHYFTPPLSDPQEEEDRRRSFPSLFPRDHFEGPGTKKAPITIVPPTGSFETPRTRVPSPPSALIYSARPQLTLRASSSSNRLAPNALGLSEPSPPTTSTRIWRSISESFVSPNFPSSSSARLHSRSTSSRSAAGDFASAGLGGLLALVGLSGQQQHASSRTATPRKSFPMSLPTISVPASASGPRADLAATRRRKISLARRNWKKYLAIITIVGMTTYVVTSFSGTPASAGTAAARNQRVGSAASHGGVGHVNRRLDARMNVQEEPADLAAPVVEVAKTPSSGISFLDADEDELIAEDDLYYDSLPNFPKGHKQTKVAGTQAGKAATGSGSNAASRSQAITSLEDRLRLNSLTVDEDGEEFDLQAMEKLVQIEAHTRQSSLMALTQFLEHGGVIPSAWLDAAPEDEQGTALDQIMAQVWKHGGGDGLEDVLAPLAENLPANAELTEEDDANESAVDDGMDELAERMRAKLEGDAPRRLKQKANFKAKSAAKASIYTAPGGKAFQVGWRKRQAEAAKLVIFSKSYCPYSKRAKETIAKYKPVPAPFIVELDKRSDGPVLQSLLHALTSRRTVPNILLNYEPLGGSDEIMLLEAEGGLRKILVDAGVAVRYTRR